MFLLNFLPHGGHCKRLVPIWDALAGIFKTEKNVVIASVDADQYKDLGTKHGVSGFPTLIYFSKSDKAGERYNGGREIQDLVSHVNTAAGTFRLENGRYEETVGRSSSLDELAKKFISNPSDREAIVKEAQSEADASGDVHVVWYPKFMNVIIKKGDDWVSKERERIEGLLSSDAVVGEKIDEFIVRLNILKAFL